MEGDIVDLSRRIRLVQRQLHRAQRGRDDVQRGLLSARTASLAIMVYVFSGHDLDVAAEFLAFSSNVKAEQCNLEDMRCLVERAYIAEPTPRIVELMSDACLEKAERVHANVSWPFHCPLPPVPVAMRTELQVWCGPLPAPNGPLRSFSGALRLPSSLASEIAKQIRRPSTQAAQVVAEFSESLGSSIGNVAQLTFHAFA